ncbi:MAG: hypothetical protein GF331_13145 [Chitinivibrionales bacterium]|nr:hypothetical protein [Chitinivibrionales bacterium]
MRKVAVFLLICGVVCGGRSQEHGSGGVVSKYGRGIQCDGFLMEWEEQAALPVPGFPAAAWDASNTPRGLAGYIRVPSGGSCSPVSLVLTQPDSDSAWQLTVVGSDTGAGEWYATAVHGQWRIVEFELPWETLQIDSSHAYAVRAQLRDTCGGQGAWWITGTSESPLRRVLTPTVVRRIVLIVVLLVAYAALYIRLKTKRNRRTE